MSKYLIHACPDRLWYVYGYLVPSMRNQGIKDIDVRCDRAHLGNLQSCMKIFSTMEGDGGTWHLQDDVYLCSDFKKRTEENDEGVVCGFIWYISANIGVSKPAHMWYSFPCIRIPNKIARECAEWFYTEAIHDPKYADWVKENKYDDEIFKEFMIKFYPDEDILHLTPSLVDHIDYAIGGSVLNNRSGLKTRASRFDDRKAADDFVEELMKKQMR